MTTPEQQAREMLGRMKVEHADYYSAGDLIELANLIAERDALKAELAAIKGAGEPYCRVYEWDTEFGLIKSIRPDNFNGKRFDRVVPLYTRPCAPLTDERIESMLVTTDGFTERERKLIKIVARATEAAHGIKGAKP